MKKYNRCIKYNKKYYSRIRDLTPYLIDLGFKHEKIHPGGIFAPQGISPLEYRKISPTKAHIKTKTNLKKKFIDIFIHGDFEKLTELRIPVYFKKDLIKFFDSAIKEKLLKENFEEAIKRVALIYADN